MKGTWIGTYKHEGKRIPESIRNRRTYFKIKIDQFDGISFSGTVQDDLETGGTRGTGIIEGKISGNKISFTKQMPVQTAIDKNGNRIETESPHRKIYYSGELQDNKISGLWRFKPGIGFFQRKLAIFPPTKGSWEMTKE